MFTRICWQQPGAWGVELLLKGIEIKERSVDSVDQLPTSVASCLLWLWLHHILVVLSDIKSSHKGSFCPSFWDFKFLAIGLPSGGDISNSLQFLVVLELCLIKMVLW